MTEPLTVNEVAALFGFDEGRVRKDVEHGVFGSMSPPRFELAAMVYLRTLAEFGFELGVDDRRKLYDLIRKAVMRGKPPKAIELSPVVDLKIGNVIIEVKRRVGHFEAWKKARVSTDDRILAGEPVFAGTRLSVRHLGSMLLSGSSPAEIRQDYPYLTDEDIECAKLFTQAYPRVGRPRERHQAAAR